MKSSVASSASTRRRSSRRAARGGSSRARRRPPPRARRARAARRGERRARRRPPRRRSASAAAAGSPGGCGTRRRRRAGPRPGCRAPGAPRCSAARSARSIPSWSAISRPVMSGCAWSSSRSSSSRAVGVSTQRSQAQIEGGDPPYLRDSVARHANRRGGATMTADVRERATSQRLRLLDGAAGTSATGGCAAPRRVGRVGGVRREGRGAAAPRRARQRGRVPHRPRRRLHRDVVPLLRPRDRRCGRSTGPTAGARACSTRRCSGRSPATSASSRARTRSTGRPILVRFTWSGVTTPTPRWEQAFSDDGGETWETNWVMDFTPARRSRVSALEQQVAAASAPTTGTSRSRRAAAERSRSATRSSSGTTSRRATRRSRSRSARSRGAASGRVASRASSASRTALGFVDPPPLRRRLLLPPRVDVAQRNELWETVWAKDGDGRRLLPSVADSHGTHRPTFCVWELGAVAHERQAWRRFLRSARDETARRGYLRDLFAGAV